MFPLFLSLSIRQMHKQKCAPELQQQNQQASLTQSSFSFILPLYLMAFPSRLFCSVCLTGQRDKDRQQTVIPTYCVCVGLFM